MSKPIVCLDFDGVIHSYTSGWKGARNIPDDPVPGVFPYIVELLVEGFDVVVHSSRSRSFGGIWAMKAWFKKHAGNMYYDCPAGFGMERVRFVRRKPPAILTIDDRALTFDGDWSSTRYSAEAIRAFKPWNKRPASYCFAMLDPTKDGGRICDVCEATWPSREEFSCVRKPGQW